IILDGKHNCTHIEEVEVVECDINDGMIVKALRLHDNEEVSYCIAYVGYFVEKSDLECIAPRTARFESKSVFASFMTLFAGPAMNFVLAFVLFTLLFYINGKPTEEPVVGVVADDTPAEDAGLEEGDRLLTINGTEVD